MPGPAIQSHSGCGIRLRWPQSTTLLRGEVRDHHYRQQRIVTWRSCSWLLRS